MIEILAVSQIPIVMTLALLYFTDKHEKEPLWLLFLCFLGGLVVAPIAGGIEFLLLSPAGIVEEPLPAALSAFLGVALVEEGLKFLVLIRIVYRRVELNEPFDGILYALAVSLGFAAIENFDFVFRHGVVTGWVRMFSAIPLHATAGVLMGFFVGLARFGESRLAWRRLATAFLVATLAHGMYDYFLFLNRLIFLPGALVVVLIQILLSWRAVRIHRQYSPERVAREEIKQVIPLLAGKAPLAVLSLALLGLLCTLWFLSFLALLFFPQALPDYGISDLGGLGALLGFVSFGLATGVKGGKVFAWILACLAFILILPTMLFPIGLLGLLGLALPIAEKVRQRSLP